MLKKEITFIYMDKSEEQNFKPIYNEAINRGYKAKFTTNKFERCNIGFYCQHNNFPQFSKFSVIMLHDIIQGYPRWPDIWFLEPWDKYDIGILPGKQWTEMWEYSSRFFYAKTQKGVYEVGWPKSDVVNDIDVDETKKELTVRYNYDPDKPTVLYAPAWENDGKQDEFVKAMLDLDVNILVKQAAVNPDIFPEQFSNIEAMKLLHKDIDRVIILDPSTNIINAISVSDILVSEESSTMCEAIMMGIPAISVSNWLIPDVTPSRFPKNDYPFVIKTQKENLSDSVTEVIRNYKQHKDFALNYSRRNFANIGSASKIIMDIIDSYVEEKQPQIKPLKPNKTDQKLDCKTYIRHMLNRFKIEIVHNYSVNNKLIKMLYKIYRMTKI